jgi:hypothetical protein
MSPGKMLLHVSNPTELLHATAAVLKWIKLQIGTGKRLLGRFFLSGTDLLARRPQKAVLVSIVTTTIIIIRCTSVSLPTGA